MKILEKEIDWYIDQMDEPFSFPGYSDAEMFCLVGERVGSRTGYGQKLATDANDLLLETLRKPGRMWPAFPKIMLSFPQGPRVRNYVASLGDISFYERDMVTDDLASQPGGLKPLIAKLRAMKVGLVGHPGLKELDVFDFEFFPTEPNDFHLNREGMKKVVEDIKKSDCDIYLFSCGISAACMIGQVHGQAVMFDCGSMWDAYVGIGGQREWRAKLYADEDLLANWKQKNEPGNRPRQSI